ncbi:MAG: transglutaminase domain-containing protein [Christensenellales bacterium]
MFQISSFFPVLIIAGVMVILLGHATYFNAKRRAVALALVVLWALILFALTLPEITNGLRLVANHIADILGQRFGQIFTHYQIGAAASQYESCITFFLLPLSIVFAFVCVYIVRSSNRIVAAILLPVFMGFLFTTEIEPNNGWTLLFFAAMAVAVYRHALTSGTIRLANEGKTTLQSIAAFSSILIALSVLFSVMIPAIHYQKSAFSTDVKNGILAGIHQMRYERQNPSSLPQGDFTSLNELELREIPALELTMSQPDSLYLRGYVGSVYTSSGWEDVERTQMYENVELFYQLHDSFFYGQTQLADIAYLLDSGEADIETNDITINNINASSKYVYAPYEVFMADESLLSPQKIGDLSLTSQGLCGNRTYTYTALPSQVSRYTELVRRLHDVQHWNHEDLQKYLIDESHYNNYVYDSFTAIPDETAKLLSGYLGGYELEEGSMHYSYQKAKQEILECLSGTVGYNEAVRARPSDTDFVQDFLKNTQEGYSVHYATTATLMFRYYGIPARYVEGYIIPPSLVENTNPGDTLSLTGTYAHAWTEFYQDGIGWIPFEVTPPYLNVMKQADLLQGYEVNDGESQTGNNTESGNLDFLGDTYEKEKELPKEGPAPANLMMVLGYLFSALAIASVLFLLYYIMRKRTALRKRLESFNVEDTPTSIRNMFSYSMDLLEALRLSPYSGKSLYSLSSQITQKCSDMPDTSAYFRALENYQEAMYSRHTMHQSQREANMALNQYLIASIKNTTGFMKRFVLRVIQGLY